MARQINRKDTYRETERYRYWRKQIRSWERSGLTQTAFCADRGLSVSAFGWWKSELKRRGVLTHEGVRKASGSEVFIPVHIESDSPQAGTADVMEVALPSGPILRIPAGFDTTHLTRLLDVLESRC